MYKLNNISTPKKLLETVNDLGVRSNRNLLINPDFAINQRGNSSYSNIGYACDRWYKTTGATTGILEPSQFALKYTAISTANFFNQAEQRIDQNFSKMIGKTLTLSAKATITGTGIYRIAIRFFSDNFSTIISTSEVDITNGVPTSITATIPSGTTRISALLRSHNQVSGDVITWHYAKLELGSIATPFVPPLTAEELPKCQRYYQKIISTGGSANTLGYGVLRTSTESRFNIPLSATLRTTPTIAKNGLRVFNFVTGTDFTPNGTVAIGSINNNSAFVHVTHSESMGTAGAFVQTYGAIPTDFISFDAEIY